jgi:hypothetical protein
MNKQHKGHSFYCNESVTKAGKILLFLADENKLNTNDFFYYIDLCNFLLFSIFCM